MANAKTTLEHLIDLPLEQAIMLISPHGMGKSSLVKQAAEVMDATFYDVRLSQCEVGDIKGLPFLNEDTRTTEFFKPRWWPRDMNSKGILFFDELNRANQETQQAVFEIVLDRRLDGDYLPDGWRVVAAINGDDRYQVSELDPALFDRFFVVDFKPEVQEWLDWAADAGIHNSIRQFVAGNPEHLDPPGDLVQGTVYPSRRSWDKFNRAMTTKDQWERKDPVKINEVAMGWIGRAAAIKFTNFFVKDFKLLSGEDLINNYEKVEADFKNICGDITAVASVTGAICKYVSSLENVITDQQVENLKKIIYALPKEVATQLWIEVGRTKSVRKKIASIKKDDPNFIKYIARLYASANA